MKLWTYLCRWAGGRSKRHSSKAQVVWLVTTQLAATAGTSVCFSCCWRCCCCFLLLHWHQLHNAAAAGVTALNTHAHHLLPPHPLCRTQTPHSPALALPGLAPVLWLYREPVCVALLVHLNVLDERLQLLCGCTKLGRVRQPSPAKTQLLLPLDPALDTQRCTHLLEACIPLVLVIPGSCILL